MIRALGSVWVRCRVLIRGQKAAGSFGKPVTLNPKSYILNPKA